MIVAADLTVGPLLHTAHVVERQYFPTTSVVRVFETKTGCPRKVLIIRPTKWILSELRTSVYF